jgi:hypothetical protein
MTTVQETKAVRRGAMGAAMVACICLLWALFGSPPYAFFGIMKWVVAASSAYLAVLLWRRSPAFAPLCLILFAVASVHVLGKMRRDDWKTFNWAGVSALSIGSLPLLKASKQERSIGTQGEHLE